ncbi:MAG: tRNA guanosine(34) transglycosylase Tgt [Patescibacteria group bacterium]
MQTWEKKEKKGERRIGTLTTKSGVSNTPVFMPIATKGAVKHLLPEEVGALGASIILGNTYHLWLRPGNELIAKAGGLHKFMDWDGIILTDSGGFQVFSLGARAEQRFGINGVKMTEEGVEFSDPKNGNRYFLSPEISIDIQLDLDSDIIMVLDECPPYPCTREYAKSSLERTTRWAKRAKEHFEKRVEGRESRPLLFGIIQGSVYEDLRQESARQLIEIGFDGYAVGGVAVGEPRETLADVLAWTLPSIPEDKPRYLMGLGRPEEIVRAVEAGVDMFDCVIPTREGRHGRLFVWTDQSLNVDGSFYETINIQNEKHREDFTPVDSRCDCHLCTRYTRAYLRHLFTVDEPLAGRLASVHNLRFYLRLMEELRKSETEVFDNTAKNG